MNFNTDKFTAFIKSNDSRIWDVGNNALYRLCRENPKHKRVDEVVAKLWLIGRSYAAAIERRENKVETNERFYVKAARVIIESDIDRRIEGISFGEELLEENIFAICNVHSFLTGLFYKITKLYKASLASKYLHFHNPIVPILDSRARKGMSKIFKQGKSYVKYFGSLKRAVVIDSDKKFNDYLSFIAKIYCLQQHILRRTGKVYTVREIDKFLMEDQET